MGLFKKEQHQRAPYKKRDKETLDSALERALVQKAKTDKEWALRAALSRFNISDETPNPAIKKKNEIKAKVYDSVFDKILKNPELADRFEDVVMAEIFEQMNINPDKEYDEGYYHEPGDEISRTIKSIRTLKQLQSELGGETNGGGGFLKSLFDSEFGQALGAALAGKMINMPQQPVQEPKYIVKVDGQITEVSESRYRGLLEQGRIAPVAELGTVEKPRNITPDSEVPVIEQSDEEVKELPEYLRNLNFESIAEYIDQEPEQFVDNLRSLVEEGDDELKFLWGFLKVATPDGIINLITPYLMNPEIGSLVEKIIANVEWLTRVTDYIKEIENDGHGNSESPASSQRPR